MAEPSKTDRLESWKEIADFLGKDVRTLFRWTKELGLPVHRMNTASKRSMVFAFRTELETWLRARPLPPPAAPRRRGPSPAVIAAGGFAAAGLIVTLGLIYFGPRAKATPSISVIPFKMLGPGARDEYLSQGVTSEVVDMLASTGTVRVIPAGRGEQIEGALDRPEEIRSQIGTDYLLRATMQRDGAEIQIDVEVIRIRDVSRVMSVQLREKMDRLSYLIQGIGARIAQTVGLPAAPAAAVDPDPSAVDGVMKGRYLLQAIASGDAKPWTLYDQGRYYSGRATSDANQFAANLFEKAIGLDPKFAPAYVGLADCYSNFLNFGWDYRESWLAKAEELLDKAQALSPGLPEYYAVRTVVLLQQEAFGRDRRDEAFALAQEGLARHPRHPGLNSLGGYCRYLAYAAEGRREDFDAALALKESAFWMDVSAVGNINYVELLMLDKRWEAALRALEEIRAYTPSSLLLYRRGEVLYYMGDLAGSQVAMEEIDGSLQERLYSLLFLARLAARRGEGARAAELLAKQSLIAPTRMMVPADELELASVYFGLKETARGYEHLRAFFHNPAVRARRYVYLRYIDLDPNFEAVRKDRSFLDITLGRDSWPQAEPSV